MFIDANIFIYSIVRTDERGKNCKSIIKAIDSGLHFGAINVLILDEIVWNVKKITNYEIGIESWRNVMNLSNLTILSIDERIGLKVPYFMEKYNLKPRDAIHVATMTENSISEILSEDKDFDCVKEIRRIKIEELIG